MRWVPTDSGDVTAGVYDDFDFYASVSCSAPALAGELEIPAELLAGLPNTAEEGRRTSLVVFRDGQVTTVEVGTWTVRMTAVGPDVRAQVDVN